MKNKNIFIKNNKCLCKKINSVKYKKIITCKDQETNLGFFSIFFCNKCKLGFTNPIVKESKSYLLYKKKDTSDFDVINNNFIDTIKNILSKILLKKIAKDIKVKSFLDFGTGNGRYALSASKLYKDAKIWAVDFFDHDIFKNSPNKITYSNYKKFFKSNQKFDFILLRHVIEHYHNPIELLKKLKKRLNKNGIIYIEVPNLNSGTAKIFKNKWHLYYLPRHMFHYTGYSLRKTINLAGLKPEIKKIELPIMGNIFALYLNIKNYHLLPRVLGLILHPIQVLIEYFFNSSTCLSAICKKK